MTDLDQIADAIRLSQVQTGQPVFLWETLVNDLSNPRSRAVVEYFRNSARAVLYKFRGFNLQVYDSFAPYAAGISDCASCWVDFINKIESEI